jgi:hypothetical protein
VGGVQATPPNPRARVLSSIANQIQNKWKKTRKSKSV